MSDEELLKAAELSLGNQGGNPTTGDIQRSIAASLLVIARNTAKHPELTSQQIAAGFRQWHQQVNGESHE